MEKYFTDANQAHDFTVQFLKHVHFAKHIVITSHKSPDDDSISSVLAIYRLITDLNPDKSVDILYENEPIDQYATFENFDEIKFLKNTPASKSFEEADMLIFLDGSQRHRFTSHPNKIAEFEGVKVVIDHHASQPDSFDFSLIDSSVPSNSELIYRVFGDYLTIDKELAKIFLLGILGDTGGLSYIKPNQLESFTIVRDLLAVAEIELQEFYASYRTMTVRELDLIRKLLQNTRYKEIEGWPALHYSYLDEESIKKEGYTDTEVTRAKHIYMSQYLRQVKGHSWGFVIDPRIDGIRSISMRSLPSSVNVREVLQEMEIGGGHDNAAGGEFPLERGKPVPVRECVKKMLAWLKTHPNKLEEVKNS